MMIIDQDMQITVVIAQSNHKNLNAGKSLIKRIKRHNECYLSHNQKLKFR